MRAAVRRAPVRCALRALLRAARVRTTNKTDMSVIVVNDKNMPWWKPGVEKSASS